MRLEFEPNVISSPAVENGTGTDTSIPDAINFEYLLAQGIKAAQKGDREQARSILTNAAQLDPRSEDAWMWLASISDYPEELLAFLGRALEINPENQKAISWQAATRSLLAKTLVQRAIAAHQEGSQDLAQRCLDEALELDNDCELAWFWKASFADDEDQRLEYLECVLNINSDNDEARSAIDSIRSSRSRTQINAAKAAIADGRCSDAIEMLDIALDNTPNALEAMLLKFHFTPGLNEKLRCLECVLDIAPEDYTAVASYDLLTSVLESLGSSAEQAQPYQVAVEHVEAELNSDVQMPDADTPMISAAAQDDDLSAGPVENTHAEFIDVPDNDVSPNWSTFTTSENEMGDPSIEANEPDYEDSHSNETEAATVDHEITGADTLDDEYIMTASSSLPLIAAEVYEMPVNADIDPYGHQDQMPQSIPAPAVLGSEWDKKVTGTACPFCKANNDSQSFQCGSCHAMLTLSDIESLLANPHADHQLIQQAIAEMESEYNFRSLNEDELTSLGVAHLNLRNYQAGRQYLQEAARLNPNNVILAGQVNAIAIRLEEIDRAANTPSTMPQGRTILVVDDSATVRKLISAKLEKSGHKVICAEDGVEALARIAEIVPDLVLLDITMPRMDGYEVCKNIRSNPAAQAIPVVMISGKDGFFDKVRGKMAGTTGYVTKPFGPETLMKALEMYLVPDSSHLAS